MTIRRMTIAAAMLGMLLATAGLQAADAEKAEIRPVARHVDLAICLDTSNSMDGLISAAKSKLWDIVNTLATARPQPIFRVAIYEYGNDNLNSETGWVRQVTPLTDDLDLVYKELMNLKTRGGTEYVARVVDRATQDLKWSPDKNTLKIIYVAGNEAATQDPKIKHVDAAKSAIEAGIIVNTIFCGDHQAGIQTGWQAVAQAADGDYASINQNETFTVATPYDKKLLELNNELNATYIGYGTRGKARLEMQKEQDANAATAGAPAAAQRAVAKSTGLYRNSSWDLVDASNEKDFKIEEVKEEDLPENMKKMNMAERKAYIEKMAAQRADVQKQIQELAGKQREFIDNARREQAAKSGKSLDTVLLKSLTSQAEAKGFTFEAPTTQPEGN